VALAGQWEAERLKSLSTESKQRAAQRLEEEIALLRRLWTENDVTFTGDVYHVEHVTALPKPVQSPPPI